MLSSNSSALSAPIVVSSSTLASNVFLRPEGGVKGSDVYNSTGSELLDLYVQLNRGCAKSVIDDTVAVVLSKSDEALLENLIVLSFQTRDVRGGKGERDLFSHFMQSFVDKCPHLSKAVLDLIPEYGCWKDLFDLAEKCTSLREDIYRVAVGQVLTDEAAVAANAAASESSDTTTTTSSSSASASFSSATSSASSNSSSSSSNVVESKEGEEATTTSLPAAGGPAKAKVSLLAKWLPREHCPSDMEAVKALSALLCSGSSTPLKDYRKRVSALNKSIKTVEVTMCDGEWSSLKPATIPGRALKKYMKAFLNQAVTSEHGRKAPLEDPDRVLCAQNFSSHFEKAAKGEAKVHGSDTVYPHELVAKAMDESLSKEECDGMEGQWRDMVASVRKVGSLGNALPMVDVSGSMNGIPMQVAIALGMLIAECNDGPFKDYVLTFDSNPVLHLMQGKTFVERVREVQALPWGGSTNFQAAYNLVLSHLQVQHAAAGEEPKDLIVLTDMGWDQAHGGGYHAVSSPAVKTEAVETHIQIARKAFKTCGEAINGEGCGWAAPRVIVWNLRAEYKDFHATANEEGVLNISGWATSMLRVLITHGVGALTPLAMFNAQLQDPRYGPVRDRVRAILHPTAAAAATDASTSSAASSSSATASASATATTSATASVTATASTTTSASASATATASTSATVTASTTTPSTATSSTTASSSTDTASPSASTVASLSTTPS